MSQPLYVIGCGGHGREVFAVIRAINSRSPRWQVAGFADDCPSEDNARLVGALGSHIVGRVEDLLALPPAAYVIGIGNGQARRDIDRRMTDAGWEPAVLIHPDTSLGPDVHLGPGTVIWAGVRGATNIRCGRHVHLNHNVTVGHDSDFADYVSVNPAASVAGGVHLGEGATIGSSAAVLQYLDVGEDAVVGAGAVVVRPVPAASTVKGVPAR